MENNMKKKVLFVATVDQHIRHFHYPYLEWFQSQGFEVHVASNGDDDLKYVDVKHNISFERSPFKRNNIKAYRLLKMLISSNDYQIIHCHTPVGGVIGRLAAISSRRNGTKVLYTAHGFHFYKGAPLVNWLIYYPIEKMLSRYTDVLITMNKEDYDSAKKFKAEKVELVNGVGINVTKFYSQTNAVKYKLRREMNYSEEKFILIYVAELSKRKNQQLAINLVNNIKDKIPNLVLLLVGSGSSYNELEKKVNELKLEDNVQFLGYRTDVHNLLLISDFAISTSKQEGLPVNVLEAMATGLPLVVTNARGNRDLVEHNSSGLVFEINDIEEGTRCIQRMYQNTQLRKRCSDTGLEIIDQFSINSVLSRMSKIYCDCDIM